MLSGLGGVDFVAVDAGRVGRRRRGRPRHGGPVNDVVTISSARWQHRSLGYQIQILEPIVYRDAVAVNDLEAWRYSSAMSLPA